uniref:Uncharacterized protein n=1 Tax=Anguilla anguilla TaxID=7936 RepID=A0A0E9VQY2_ANGAN
MLYEHIKEHAVKNNFSIQWYTPQVTTLR